jgi:hypothetical protein
VSGAAGAAGWPSEGLAPGARCRISEAEWFHFLERGDPLHQWGPAFLLDEGRGALVRLYARDDSGAGRHVCVRLDAAASDVARRGVIRLEVLSRRAADAITRLQDRPSTSLREMEEQDATSRRFTDAAEALYRQLIRDEPASGGTG